MCVRLAWTVVGALLLCGCATMNYSSPRPASEVSQCIAAGWRKVPGSGWELPVSVTKPGDYYFVDVVLVRDFPTFLPIHSMWAKVRDTQSGSATQYRRNLQISHKRIDRVVVACQSGTD